MPRVTALMGHDHRRGDRGMTPRPWMRKFALVAALHAALTPMHAARALAASPLIERLDEGQQQTIVVYGTSLTAGGAWVSQVASVLDGQYPGQITWINSGQSGKASHTGVALLQSAVLAHAPDAVLIEFAMNDAFTEYATTDLDYGISPEQSQANLNSMIDSLQAARPETQIVLQTMNPAWDAPNGRGSATKRPQLAAYYQGYRDVAAQRDLTLVDNNLVWRQIQDNTPSVFETYVADGTHPNAAGYATVTTPAVLWQLGADTGLTLAVDLETGRAVLQNRSAAAVDLISYSIRSPSGALQTSWRSLADRGNAQWAEANATAFALSELNATGATTLAPGVAANLDVAWDASRTLDLELVYQAADGVARAGAVVYTQLADDQNLTGDFNGDGVVSGAYFLQWQRSVGAAATPFVGADDNGDGVVDGADLAAWVSGYGTPLTVQSSTLAAVHVVPEPAAARLATVLALTPVFVRGIAGRVFAAAAGVSAN